MLKRVKLIIGIFLLLTSAASIHAQNIKYTVIKNNGKEVVVRADFMHYSTESVNVNGEIMQNLVMEDAYPVLQKGNPELLQSTFSLITPENCTPSVEILDAQYTEIPNFKLAPSKGMLYRNVNPGSVPYAKGEIYNSPKYVLGSAAVIGQQYQLRDFHGVTVKTFPFDYNPVQQKLKVYSSITMKVAFNGTENTAAAKKNNKTFDAIYGNHFLNYSQYRSAQITEEGDILIIAPEQFMAAMQPYINWKMKCGYNVEMVSVATAGGNSTAIKNYISTYYAEHNLAFLLIVGDANQFPTPVMSGDYSDNYFTELAGNDVYPDIILGKISAETIAEVETQVERFIEYERNPSETSHFPVFCGIASSEGGSYSDNGEKDFQHIRLINEKLSNFTYTSGYEFFEGSQGGLDASGNPSASDVVAAVNNGVGIITYCGHGDWNMWVSSSFNVNNVAQLTNNGKLPFILSVACVNGEYAGKTCFAEAWMRATYNGKPAGAVGFLGSTINQSWNPPMCAQDAMVDILTDQTGNTKKITFGGMFFNGMVKMLDTYNTSSDVSRTWVLFGDPTLLLRTAVPAALDIEHQEIVPMGFSDLSFISSVENAKIALTHNNEILASGKIQNGNFDATLNEVYTPADTIFVTATAQNYLPYEGTATFIPNEGPYVMCSDIEISDNGNNDGLADFGETIYITPTFKNIGSDASNGTSATLSTEDAYITISTANHNVGALASEESVTSNNAFSVAVANNAPANHNATLKMTLVTGTDTVISNKKIVLHAPTPKILDFTIDDAISGNGNGRIDSGETVTLKLNVKNDGNSKAPAGIITLTNPANEVNISNTSFNIPQLEIGATATAEFEVTPQANISEPIITYLKANYTTASYVDEQYLTLKVGAVIEDWESGAIDVANWTNNSEKKWTITTQNPYEGTYCAKSGSISHSASTKLSIKQQASSADTISFYYKVSSEQGYDFLTFSIDGQKKGEWSGSIGWTRAAFPVEAGEHTFEWKYEKDYMMSSGSDCAWIDYINFPGGKISSEVGIADFAAAEIKVMPNPAQNFVNVIIENIEQYANPTYQMFDMTGKLVRGGILSNSRTEISVSNLVEGIYLLKVTDNEKVIATQKIIKK